MTTSKKPLWMSKDAWRDLKKEPANDRSAIRFKIAPESFGAGSALVENKRSDFRKVAAWMTTLSSEEASWIASDLTLLLHSIIKSPAPRGRVAEGFGDVAMIRFENAEAELSLLAHLAKIDPDRMLDKRTPETAASALRFLAPKIQLANAEMKKVGMRPFVVSYRF